MKDGWYKFKKGMVKKLAPHGSPDHWACEIEKHEPFHIFNGHVLEKGLFYYAISDDWVDFVSDTDPKSYIGETWEGGGKLTRFEVGKWYRCIDPAHYSKNQIGSKIFVLDGKPRKCIGIQGKPDPEMWAMFEGIAGGSWCYNPVAFEEVPAPQGPKCPMPSYLERHKACGLKVGDRVRVTRKAKDNEDGWENPWLIDKDPMVGKTYPITKDDNSCGFELDNIAWAHFPYFVLEKVEEEKKVYTKEGGINPDGQIFHNGAWPTPIPLEQIPVGSRVRVISMAPRQNENTRARIGKEGTVRSAAPWMENVGCSRGVDFDDGFSDSLYSGATAIVLSLPRGKDIDQAKKATVEHIEQQHVVAAWLGEVPQLVSGVQWYIPPTRTTKQSRMAKVIRRMNTNL